MDYKKISQDVVDHVGGISNIKGATHCVTRLRLILNDETKYDRKALENIEGVKGVLFNSGQLMIIFGTGTVNNVYDAFIELTGVKEMSQSDAKAEGKQGSMLKKIGTNARYEMERLLDCKVNLKLWVKVKKDWRDSDFLIKNFGYKEEE